MSADAIVLVGPTDPLLQDLAPSPLDAKPVPKVGLHGNLVKTIVAEQYLVRQLAGTATDRAMLAWGKAIDAASRVGAYTDVVFDDPAIHAAIEDMGGWPKFCRGDVKDLSYLQHRFDVSKPLLVLVVGKDKDKESEVDDELAKVANVVAVHDDHDDNVFRTVTAYKLQCRTKIGADGRAFMAAVGADGATATWIVQRHPDLDITVRARLDEPSSGDRRTAP